MRELAFVTLDVFTEEIFGGNPLAVFPDTPALGEREMQAIAREFNLSETVFVRPADDPGHAARLRIFTPEAELPFAGHPTVGAAICLAEAGRFGAIADEARVIFEEGAGPVPVRFTRGRSGWTATLTSPRLPQRLGPGMARATLAAILGLREDAFAPGIDGGVYSAGVAFEIVPLKDEAALAAARFRPGAWSAAGSPPLLYLLTMADWRCGRDVRARMFAPGLGIAEDPATGAAAAALAGFLAEVQRPADGQAAWTVAQGIEMGRPSQIAVSADIAGAAIRAAHVGGTAVTVSRGVFLLPGAGG
jgi:trans-2,3-dihydro-3-hydroxyanthranilate isomerase